MMLRRRYVNSDTSSDEDDLLMVEYANRRRPQTFRDRTNYLDEFDDYDFSKRFRLTKTTVSSLLLEIEESLDTQTNRNHAVLPMDQLLLALRFYATGSMFVTVGDFSGVHNSTASKIVHRVSAAIAALRPRYIRLPQTDVEVQETYQKFYNIARFPRVIGALDCTHVRIQSPGGGEAENFRNRKGYFSLNVQTLSGPRMEIFDIVARWPGSTHDATIFGNSALCGHFEAGGMGNSIIVADSGYGIRSYLMTPLQQTRTRAQELYNESLIRTRNVVERQYGILKRRFPVLAAGLRVKLENIQPIIVAVAILHNIALQMGEELPPEDPEVAARVDYELGFINQGVGLPQQRGEMVRQAMINDYFRRLV